MRYYDIQLLDNDGNATSHYTTLDGSGKTNLGALQVEFDIPMYAYATPGSAITLKIWGISLADISQVKDLNDKKIKLYAGFRPGLPLATLAYNAKQSGLILQGVVYQAFANWVGVNQWLELFIVSTDAAVDQKLNVTFQWSPGQSFQAAMTQTLQTAFGAGASINFAITDKLSTSEVVTHKVESLTEFGQFIQQLTQPIIGGSYAGVQVYRSPTSYQVYDYTVAQTPKEILYTDLIGQPTWLDPASIQLTVALRSDISPGDLIKLPQTAVVTQSGVINRFQNPLAYQGTFSVQSVRHIGDFKQADAMAWITIIECYSNSPAS